MKLFTIDSIRPERSLCLYLLRITDSTGHRIHRWLRPGLTGTPPGWSDLVE